MDPSGAGHRDVLILLGCLPHRVPLDEAALDRIGRALASQAWDVVVIGGGIRKPEALLEFFEAVVNLVPAGPLA